MRTGFTTAALRRYLFVLLLFLHKTNRPLIYNGIYELFGRRCLKVYESAAMAI